MHLAISSFYMLFISLKWMTTVSCFPGTKSPIDSTIYLFPMHVTMLLIVQYSLVTQFCSNRHILVYIFILVCNSIKVEWPDIHSNTHIQLYY